MLSVKFLKNYIYLHIVQFVASSRKMLELLQDGHVSDVINVVFIDIQDTKRLLCKDFKVTQKE